MLSYKKVLVDSTKWFVESYENTEFGYSVRTWTFNKSKAFDFTNTDAFIIDELKVHNALEEDKVLNIQDTLSDKEKEYLNKTMKRVLR